MAPRLAALLTTIFVISLYFIDFKNNPKGLSKGIFVPLIWMFICATRSFSFWITLDAQGVGNSVDIYMEGNPIDRAFYLFLIILGIIVLFKRRINLKNIVKTNKFVFIYFLFGLISIFWSDYPYVSLKRLIKSFGNIIMVLIILTEENPEEAFGIIIRYISFFYIPVSVLFIKYYPELGRSYTFTGNLMFTGVSSQKNGLGKSLLIIGIYYFWNFIFNRGKNTTNDRPIKIPILLLIIPFYIYLFMLADSATSLFCLYIGIIILIICKLPLIQKNPVRIITNGIYIVFVLLLLEFSIGLSSKVIEFLGRDPTLTTRVPMWNMLLSMARNPILGAGYESFWLGDRLLTVWSRFGEINQAHNGYLETYLNLGLIGFIILLCQIISGFIKIRKQLLINYTFSILKLAFLIIIIFYNWTEASFHGPNLIWIIFFVCIIEIPKTIQNKREQDFIIENEYSIDNQEGL